MKITILAILAALVFGFCIGRSVTSIDRHLQAIAPIAAVAPDTEIRAFVDGCCAHALSIEKSGLGRMAIRKIQAEMNADPAEVRKALKKGCSAAGWRLIDKDGNTIEF